MDVNSCLVIRSSREDLALLSRDRGISFNQFGCDAAQCLDGQGKRRNIEQQYIVYFAGQNACLNRRADRDAFIRVDALERFFAGDFLDCFLYCRNSGGAADSDNLRDIRVGDACILHRLFHRLDGSLYQMLGQLIEFCSCDVFVHVQRTFRGYSNER